MTSEERARTIKKIIRTESYSKALEDFQVATPFSQYVESLEPQPHRPTTARCSSTKSKGKQAQNKQSLINILGPKETPRAGARIKEVKSLKK